MKKAKEIIDEWIAGIDKEYGEGSPEWEKATRKIANGYIRKELKKAREKINSKIGAYLSSTINID